MCVADKVWINELTLIHKNIRSVRSVRNSHVQVYRSIRHKIKILGQFVTRMFKCIGQSDVKHIMTSPIKTITSVLKASTDSITKIQVRPIRLTEILAIMSCLDLLPLFYISCTLAFVSSHVQDLHSLVSCKVNGFFYEYYLILGENSIEFI